MNETEAAWTAGFFEGEGCIGLGTSQAPNQVRLWVTNTDLDVLERFAATVGCGHITAPRRAALAHHKPCRMWHASKRADVARLLTEWHPWLGTRRRARADIALARLPRFEELQLLEAGSGYSYSRSALRQQREAG